MCWGGVGIYHILNPKSMGGVEDIDLRLWGVRSVALLEDQTELENWLFKCINCFTPQTLLQKRWSVMSKMENDNDDGEDSESETELGLPLFRPFTRSN